jgi:SM-20-related protein
MAGSRKIAIIPVFFESHLLDSELITHDLYTQGYHIIDNFLAKEHCESLHHLAQKMYNKGLFRSAKIGLKIASQSNPTIRTDEIFWMDEQSRNYSIQAYLKQTNALASLLNQTLFLCLSDFETHFAAYQPGTFYKKHCDQFANQKTRKISCVYYLNPHWEEDFGGELKIYKEEQLIQTVWPQGNRFICFNSELVHEVCLTHHVRYSIAGWLKTRMLQN